MLNFIEEFRRNGDFSFNGMRNVAVSLLTKDRAILNALYDDLNRGKGILDDELHLNMYLRCFANMHKAKLDAAFRSLPNISEIFDEEMEIFDWGCGQGTATICLLDHLKQQGIKHNIKQINLIDPSVPATGRASEVISCFDPDVKVNIINKVFDTLNEEDFTPTNIKKLHLFSNILDVEFFDLAQFILLFQKCCHGPNFFICVGPYYSNNKRADDFIAATEPDETYASFNKGKGEWINEWTISLRIFFKEFCKVESVQDIRKRIEESHKKDQFFAGYILDSISEEYQKGDVENEIESLYRSLSIFDVKSNKTLDIENEHDSKLAVLSNIISRGLPTKAPIIVEEIFSDLFKISNKPEGGSVINYKSTHKISQSDIIEALHIIDPRFDIDFYNGDILQSSFEKDFLEKYLKGTDCEYLVQILEPQRPLSSIVNIPDRRFSKDQNVDFAIEIPYGDSQTGFIFETDGAPYHSNIFQKLNDERRDRMSSSNNWDTYRIDHLYNDSYIKKWEEESDVNRYLSFLRRNSEKKINGRWRDILQIVLSPLAIARVQKMLLQALLSGVMHKNLKVWNIVIVERDVPCAAIAVKLFEEYFGKITALEGSNDILPQINLSIVTSEEFKSSPLHLGNKTSTHIPETRFNLCIDVSILLRDNIDAMPLNVEAETYYIIRSSHYRKRERVICSAENIIYPPMVKKNANGTYESIQEREELLTFFLREIFRKPSFRHGQLPILSRSLSDKTTIGLLPTGGGKSLTYQLSSILQPGVTIIVDPLVSLMVDQVRGLHESRIDISDCVHSGMKAKEKTSKLNMLQNGSLQFLLLSPERYMMKEFRDSLINMSERNHINFAYGVIDEVHCVSEWGHDFRPSYLHLGRNMINFMRTRSGRPLPIIGLTATASFDVLADVERELTLGGNLTIDSETVVRPENDSRPELTYRIINTVSDFDSLRDQHNSHILKATSLWDLKDIVIKSKKRKMYDMLKVIPFDIESLNHGKEHETCHINNYSADSFFIPDNNGKYDNAGIIFCPHAHGSFGVVDNQWGTQAGISTGIIAEHYSILKVGTFIGGDKPAGDMKRFNENDQNLMVATKAFGMGIDKPNIRFTIHINHPASIESYVQEAGRGGRDKKHAISYVLFDSTEYVHLTIDKVNDLRVALISATNVDPQWMELYANKFILRSDIVEWAKDNNCTNEIAQLILSLCIQKGYIENVDKDINLWFHNNSFRGLFKEKVILLEMTDRILNVKPSHLLTIQNELIEQTAISDILLRLDINQNAIIVQDNIKNQYGFIWLDNLKAIYKCINFEETLCRYICNTLIKILQTYDNHSAQALAHPIEGTDNTSEGIYSAMEKTDAEGYLFITVSWENQIKLNSDEFERSIRMEILKIAEQEDPSINKEKWENINEERYGKLKLKDIQDFESLISEISKCSGDTRWLRFHGYTKLYENLMQLFFRKRDKDDTDKAIYRMCCIGLVEDVTIDYLSQTYELKIRKKTDEEYKQHMLEFFHKYYSLEQAKKRVSEIDSRKGRNYIDKCLGYLTAFVYDNLEKKRLRAIDDMRNACQDSISNREDTNSDEWLKEFIHLYFNSKYARQDYELEGENYSLKRDTDTEGRYDFGVVLKYIDVIPKDPSGSEIDNVKHLYGATLLCLRAHPDNAALLLLHTYCINFLGAGNNETLKSDAREHYIEGFMKLYKSEGSKIWQYLNQFNEHLKRKAKEESMKENLIKNGKETVMLWVHEDRFNNIKNKYLN